MPLTSTAALWCLGLLVWELGMVNRGVLKKLRAKGLIDLRGSILTTCVACIYNGKTNCTWLPFLCGLFFSCFLRSRERQQNAKVKAVLPDGQLAEWNKINPDSAIRPYDACPNLAKLSIPYAFSSEFSEWYRIDIFVNESKLPFKDKIFKVNGKERKSRAAAWTTNTETLKFSPFLPAGRYSSRTWVFHRVFKPGPEPCLENPCKGKIVCDCHMLCQFCEFVCQIPQRCWECCATTCNIRVI